MGSWTEIAGLKPPRRLFDYNLLAFNCEHVATYDRGSEATAQALRSCASKGMAEHMAARKSRI
jgi:hypothetical protein